jgi:aminoglycoside/choline kinase family phosphotransferase
MHEVLVRYDADAAARQHDLAQQWESERAANREWTTKATTAFAASVAEHSMVCLVRSTCSRSHEQQVMETLKEVKHGLDDGVAQVGVPVNI